MSERAIEAALSAWNKQAVMVNDTTEAKMRAAIDAYLTAMHDEIAKRQEYRNAFTHDGDQMVPLWQMKNEIVARDKDINGLLVENEELRHRQK